MKKLILFLITAGILLVGNVLSGQNQYTQRLDKEEVTLIMVDFLEGFVPGIRTIDRNLFYANAEALAQVGNIFKLPTIMLGDEGGFRGKFFPVVVETLPEAIYIERHTVSAWDEPKFREQIEAFGNKKIVMGGISLDICTTQLALDLLNNGYEVYVVVDASGSDTQLNELAAMLRLTQAGAVTMSWGVLASELMKDWATPEGPLVGKLYQELSYWGSSELDK